MQKLTSKDEATVWWKRVKEVTEKAKISGSLKSFPTRDEHVIDEGIQWIIRIATALQNKPQNFPQEGDKVEQRKEEVHKSNPFLPPDPDLTICEMPQGTHNLLLNKYNVVPHHMLLTTVDFESQLDPLNSSDFIPLWHCVRTFNALAFYNSGSESGASQPHKHMQLIPLPFDSTMDVDFPLEVVLQRESEGLQHRGQVFQVKTLGFKHACVSLDGLKVGEEAVELERYYNTLMREVGVVEGSSSYNFLLTSKWMIIIGRSQESYKEHSVNSVGFAGTLLVKSEEQLLSLKEIGPLNLLRQVALPL